jgi:hypothetical protein
MGWGSTIGVAVCSQSPRLRFGEPVAVLHRYESSAFSGIVMGHYTARGLTVTIQRDGLAAGIGELRPPLEGSEITGSVTAATETLGKFELDALASATLCTAETGNRDAVGPQYPKVAPFTLKVAVA